MLLDRNECPFYLFYSYDAGVLTNTMDSLFIILYNL